MSSLVRKLRRKREERLKKPSFFLTKEGQANQRVGLEKRYIQKTLLQRVQEPQVAQRQGR